MSMKAVLSSALILLMAVPAFAVSTTIDFTGNGGVIGYSEQPFTITAGDLSVNLSAWSHPDGAGADAPFSSLEQERLHQCQNGMGVYSAFGDTPQLDAGRFEADEMMMVDFGQDVILESIHFSLADSHDEFDLAVNNVDIGITSLFGSDIIRDIGTSVSGNGIQWDYIVDFTFTSIIGSSFQFYTDDNNDGYKVVGMRVSEVPEPTTMGLLGIAALSALGLRRKENVA